MRKRKNMAFMNFFEPKMNCQQTLMHETQAKGRLRFVLCGSVDDGKSTLIGRLLYDAGLIYEDHLCALEADSKHHGAVGRYDFSLLLDGLAAEREQKITIDVAYRFFATSKRNFIVADAPGHVQYTQNMATAASTADCAVVLIDAVKGLMPQTRRHTMIASYLGIKHIILLVNKMDLVQYDAQYFETLRSAYQDYAKALGVRHIIAIPVSALHGDNVTQHSQNMPWYEGQTLLTCLEDLDIEKQARKPFRMHVQWVNRACADFRGFSGRIVSGTVTSGEIITILPSEQQATVARIVTFDGDLEQAHAGQSITITLKEDIDVSRGDVLSSIETPPQIADRFTADLIWIAKSQMTAGRQYRMKIGTQDAVCTLSKPSHVLDMNTLASLKDTELHPNQIGRCTVVVDRKTVCEPFHNNPPLGRFILIDTVSQDIVALGMVNTCSLHAMHIPYQPMTISPKMRADLKSQKPLVLWFTGLSGAGKSTLANGLEQKLYAQGRHTMLLDANNMRHGLNKDLNFSDSDRIENTRRIAETAKVMAEAGLITLVACIAPFTAERLAVRELMGSIDYVEVFVDVPLSVAEARDVRGLYAKARKGEITQFTGVSARYEEPETPDVRIDTEYVRPDEAVQTVFDWLLTNQKIPT